MGGDIWLMMVIISMRWLYIMWEIKYMIILFILTWLTYVDVDMFHMMGDENDIHEMRWLYDFKLRWCGNAYHYIVCFALHCWRLCRVGANLKINLVGVDLIGCRVGTSLITSHQTLGQRYLNLRAHVGDTLCIGIIYCWYYWLLDIYVYDVSLSFHMSLIICCEHVDY